MDLPKNAFKAALKAGRTQIGLWNTLPDSGVVELLAGCGYDWLLIDTEHSPMDPVSVLPLLQAAAPYPVSPVVRATWNNPVEIKRLLDCGAQTLMLPYVQSAAEAAVAVSAMRYPPRGTRGVAGTTRASRYGAIPDYTRRADGEICVLVQVESAEALSRIEAIAAVDGVDGIFIGPADLAATMGHPGQINHPEVRAAILDGIRRITAAGLPAGFLSMDDTLLREVEAAGAQFIAIGLDAAFLRKAVVAARAAWT